MPFQINHDHLVALGQGRHEGAPVRGARHQPAVQQQERLSGRAVALVVQLQAVTDGDVSAIGGGWGGGCLGHESSLMWGHTWAGVGAGGRGNTAQTGRGEGGGGAHHDGAPRKVGAGLVTPLFDNEWLILTFLSHGRDDVIEQCLEHDAVGIRHRHVVTIAADRLPAVVIAGAAVELHASAVRLPRANLQRPATDSARRQVGQQVG